MEERRNWAPGAMAILRITELCCRQGEWGKGEREYQGGETEAVSDKQALSERREDWGDRRGGGRVRVRVQTQDWTAGERGGVGVVNTFNPSTREGEAGELPHS